MDQETRRILKVYIRLGWLKLHDYYGPLTSITYAGAGNEFLPKTPISEATMATDS
jgi:hypothetical protein